MNDYVDFDKITEEYSSEEDETQSYKPYTVSNDAGNTILVIETPNADYDIEYRLLISATRPKKIDTKTRIHTINAMGFSFALTLHNFTDEDYQKFFRARRTQTLDTIYTVPNDTPDHGQKFITVEVQQGA